MWALNSYITWQKITHLKRRHAIPPYGKKRTLAFGSEPKPPESKSELVLCSFATLLSRSLEVAVGTSFYLDHR
jgi:hypothetical protein